MEIKVLSALAYVLVSSAAIGQQVNMGAVNGVVTDSSGAPVPNVKVTATSPALQGEEVFTTNQTGIYRFPALPLGVYKFTFEAAGFSAQVRDQVNVTLGFAATINIQVASLRSSRRWSSPARRPWWIHRTRP